MLFSWLRQRAPSAGVTNRASGRPGPRRGARLVLEVLENRTLPATILHVDANNTTGMADGTDSRPFTTIQDAVDAAMADDIIKVAQATYLENVIIPDLSVQLLGGFVGGTEAAYANGEAGDFAVAAPTSNVTQITGAIDAPVLWLPNVTAKTIVIDGFVITGGHTGIYCVADFQQFATVTISHNVIENNGPAMLQDGGTFANVGGGIFSSNATITVTDNIIRNNNANRGGGLFISSRTAYTVTGNLIENNTGWDDHGGGVVLVPLLKSASGNALFTSNVVRGNVASANFDYGWGGGILIAGDLRPDRVKPVTLRNNTWTDNFAPSTGGAIFVDDGARVILDHELIHHNRTDTAGGGAIFVNGDGSGVGSFVTIINCTIADNSSGQADGNGINAQEFCHVTVTNSIFWGNTDDFLKDGSSTIAVRFTNSSEAWPGKGNRQVDPLFANAAAGDYHLQSVAGRWDPGAMGGAGGWVQDLVHSPAIDAGDPAASFTSETTPNGRRRNLGTYGNTAEASRSVTVGTITSLKSSDTSTVFGQKVTFKAVVRGVARSSAPLNGRVHFWDGPTEIGSAPLQLVRGVRLARLSVRTLGVGSHDITATYEGNNNFAPSTSALVQQSINQALTRTTVTAAPLMVVSGQTVNLTARVRAVLPGSGKPTGTVTFMEGATVLDSAPLQEIAGIMKAKLPVSTLSVGRHRITAVYSGDLDFAGSATLLSVMVTIRAAG